MSLLYAYTLYDCKALTYSPPFFQGAHGQASRMVADLAQDPNTTVGRHPRDFTLLCIGQYNDSTGSMLPNDVREHIADVISLLPHKPADLFRNEEDNFSEPARHPVKG